jgi:acetolactate synthase-1/2/3 large subunit
MGAGLPSAMMAALLHPKLNLVVLIPEDCAYGMIRWKQVDHFPDFGLTFGNPDFVKYAESYSAKGSRVEHTPDLIPTLERAFASCGVHLVAVPIDYTENTRVLIDELAEKLKKVDGPGP